MSSSAESRQGEMSATEVLETTRSVRRRLELGRPVPRELIERCVDLALQAPSSSNGKVACFVAVDDPEQRTALAELYRKGWGLYEERPSFVGSVRHDDAARQHEQERVTDSAHYLAEHIGEVPVLVVPCVDLGTDAGQRLVQSGFTRDAAMPLGLQAAFWGSVLPAAWSFMLAARANGLGAAWTILHLSFEREAADILGIPFDTVVQTAMLPVAWTSGAFHRGPRPPASEVLHWNAW
jgi:nitroreductase